MIALLQNYEYFADDFDNIKDFLIAYAEHIGLNTKIFKILANSNDMSEKELVDYINNYCYNGEEIQEIYEIGKKLY